MRKLIELVKKIWTQCCKVVVSVYREQAAFRAIAVAKLAAFVGAYYFSAEDVLAEEADGFKEALQTVVGRRSRVSVRVLAGFLGIPMTRRPEVQYEVYRILNRHGLGALELRNPAIIEVVQIIA